MGGFQSTQTKVIMKEINQTIESSITNVTNATRQVCDGTNTLTLSNCTECTSCTYNDIDISQNITSKCTQISKNSFKGNTTFVNNIVTNMKNVITQNLKNKAGFIATGLSIQISGAKTVEQIENQITETINTNLVNTCEDVTNLYNNKTIQLCGNWDRLNASQDIGIVAYNSCVNKTIITAMLKNKVLSNFYNKTNQKLLAQESGVFSGLTGIAIIIALVVVALLILSTFGKKKDTTSDTTDDTSGNSIPLSKISSAPATAPATAPAITEN